MAVRVGRGVGRGARGLLPKFWADLYILFVITQGSGVPHSPRRVEPSTFTANEVN